MGTKFLRGQFSTELTRYNYAAVMRAARKRIGLSQMEVSQELGISQSTLSKIEHGVLVPDIFVWLRFCTLTDIPDRACVRGYIDWNDAGSRLRLVSQNRLGRFKIPRRYARLQGLSVRQANALYLYAYKNLSPSENQVFAQSLQLDPDFFVDLRNQINIQLLYDGVSSLISNGHLDQERIDSFVEATMAQECHGTYFQSFSTCESPAALLQTYSNLYGYYDCNFDIGTATYSSHFEVTLTPRDHLREFECSPEVSHFLLLFWERYFPKFILEFT